jgi:hypothetical protein
MASLQARRGLFFRALGIGALFSGVALLAHIIAGVSLRLALALTVGFLILTVCLVWRRTSGEERLRMLRRTVVGVVSGILATASYDLSKFALSQWDPSPYNPFEAIHLFGVLLVGSSASNFVVNAAGTLFHIVNGISFGLAFCLLIARPGVVTGIGWGLFLAFMQITLYPGWLGTSLYQEFATISGISHVVYGVVLGYSCQYGLQLQSKDGVI